MQPAQLWSPVDDPPRVEHGNPRDGWKWRLKAVLLWLLLVLLFVSVYQLYPEPSSRHGGPPPPDSTGTVLAEIAGLVFACLVAWVAWLAVATRRFNARHVPAVTRLNEGDLAGAEAELQALAARRFYPKGLRAMALYNAAVARMRSGDLDGALALLERAHHGSFAVVRTHARELAMCTTASCYALRGDLDAAERIVVGGRPKVGATFADHLLLPEAILALRRGRPEEAAKRLESSWVRAEGTLQARSMRGLRLLRAFAVAQLDARTHATTLGMLLDGLRPVRRGEFDYMAVAWPELRAFLETHDLSAPRG
jgi:hypothetical protein